ncbi:MAG TPA: SDR family oxidoreductase [Chloroflexota bacterium]|jgi:NAD(P)-dependent dehydrogenase (short-subunit alcohol dehydrogenase family)
MRLAGKNALITGGGSGIGRAMALAFVAEGARVFVADMRGDDAEETVLQVQQAGGDAAAFQADVSLSAEVQAMIGACLDRFTRIDVLCNNAGIGSTQSVVDTPEDLWEAVFAVNVRGMFLCCKYALPHMIEAGGGVIVNTASVAGLVGLKNRAAYCASKGAVVSLTRAMAVDHVQQKIRCNCICPGTVDSPWIGRLLDAAPDPAAERAALVARQPMGRLGTPEEVARAAVYLASDDADFVTGSALVIDGGLTAQ